MKTKFVLGLAILSWGVSNGQQIAGKEKFVAKDMSVREAQRLERQIAPEAKAESTTTINPSYGPEPQTMSASKSSAITVSAQWRPFTESMNIYGTVISNLQPLQYDDNLNAVSFIHRKGPSYVPDPFPSSSGAESGAIVAMITDNWGAEWDTTLLWNHDDYWARHPQGALYAPSSATCLNEAYVVGSGPVTSNANGWVGSFFASKKLDSLGGAGNDNTIGQGLSDHQFIASSGTAFPSGKLDYPAYDLTVTDDGVVRSLGIHVNNINGTGAAFGWKGASVVEGTFISGSFSWRSDTIIPNIYLNSAGTQMVSGTPHMAWNESGTVGYVWFIGIRTPRPGQGDTLSNMGYQPIIYKTTNSGATWTEMPRMNFNDTTGTFNPVLSQIFAVQNDSMGIPFFNLDEGNDGVVDRNDRLHLMSAVIGTFSKHPDSLSFFYVITHADGERYKYRFSPGLKPYLFDFTETNSGWKVTVIDSMSSVAPGTAVGDDGYTDNPWDAAGAPTGTDKVDTHSRLQMSRTPDGRYIIYSWAESDTGLTFLSHKWNSKPNVKVRMAEVGLETSSTVPATLTLHPLEINVTNPVSAADPPYVINNNVKDKATCHFISPKAAVISTGAGVAIGLPVTVSNNNSVPLKQLTPNTHWYLSANLNFDGVGSVAWPTNEKCKTVSLVERSLEGNSSLYPNPSAGRVNLDVSLSQSSPVQFTVLNVMGQVMGTFERSAEGGGNVFTLEVDNLPDGVYIVNIRAGNLEGNKRMLIQH